MVVDSFSAMAGELGAFNPDLLPRVSEIVSGRIREYVPASTLTTIAIGGPLRALVAVETIEELAAVRALLTSENQTSNVLGFGSNLLVSDLGVDSWIIKLGSSFKVIDGIGPEILRISGAASLMTVARKVSDEGLSGLEFAAGIPASIGGAVFMNAGAHGSEICERVVSVRGVLSDGQIVEWSRNELPWCYRFSGLPSGAAVTSVVLKLVMGDRQDISKSCADNLAHRRRTQPLALPSAGSVFKNPRPEAPAGRLIEAAGLKGSNVGGARVSDLHANWIVNPAKNASAKDVRELMFQCIYRVKATSGITLQPEVRQWGEF